MNEYIEMGRWSEVDINRLLRKSSGIKDIGERMDLISGQFLGIPYKASTLIGDINTREVFVIKLDAVDCFTFIEYVEAMRLSGSFSEFKDNLKRVRYKSGVISFNNRNHFFTDWREHNHDFVMDITDKIGITQSRLKVLNKKDDGSYILNGIHPVNRMIRYVPADNIDDSLLERLMTGDYAGIYSLEDGLDVSHVGIIIKSRKAIHLRHASKRYGKVIDEDFKEYISNKPGLLVLRPIIP